MATRDEPSGRSDGSRSDRLNAHLPRRMGAQGTPLGKGKRRRQTRDSPDQWSRRLIACVQRRVALVGESASRRTVGHES